MECVEQLNKLLDVDEPWTWVCHDPSGLSDFSDMTDVQVRDIYMCMRAVRARSGCMCRACVGHVWAVSHNRGTGHIA